MMTGPRSHTIASSADTRMQDCVIPQRADPTSFIPWRQAMELDAWPIIRYERVSQLWRLADGVISAAALAGWLSVTRH